MISTTLNPLVITAGEPAGIGPDLCIALAQTEWSNRVVVIADPECLKARARQLHVDVTILPRKHRLCCWLQIPCG